MLRAWTFYRSGESRERTLREDSAQQYIGQTALHENVHSTARWLGPVFENYLLDAVFTRPQDAPPVFESISSCSLTAIERCDALIAALPSRQRQDSLQYLNHIILPLSRQFSELREVTSGDHLDSADGFLNGQQSGVKMTAWEAFKGLGRRALEARAQSMWERNHWEATPVTYDLMNFHLNNVDVEDFVAESVHNYTAIHSRYQELLEESMKPWKTSIENVSVRYEAPETNRTRGATTSTMDRIMTVWSKLDEVLADSAGLREKIRDSDPPAGSVKLDVYRHSSFVDRQAWRSLTATIDFSNDLPVHGPRIDANWTQREVLGDLGVSTLWVGAWRVTWDRSLPKRPALSIRSKRAELWFSKPVTVSELVMFVPEESDWRITGIVLRSPPLRNKITAGLGGGDVLLQRSRGLLDDAFGFETLVDVSSAAFEATVTPKMNWKAALGVHDIITGEPHRVEVVDINLSDLSQISWRRVDGIRFERSPKRNVTSPAPAGGYWTAMELFGLDKKPPLEFETMDHDWLNMEFADDRRDVLMLKRIVLHRPTPTYHLDWVNVNHWMDSLDMEPGTDRAVRVAQEIEVRTRGRPAIWDLPVQPPDPRPSIPNVIPRTVQSFIPARNVPIAEAEVDELTFTGLPGSIRRYVFSKLLGSNSYGPNVDRRKIAETMLLKHELVPVEAPYISKRLAREEGRMIGYVGSSDGARVRQEVSVSGNSPTAVARAIEISKMSHAALVFPEEGDFTVILDEANNKLEKTVQEAWSRFLKAVVTKETLDEEFWAEDWSTAVRNAEKGTLDRHLSTAFDLLARRVVLEWLAPDYPKELSPGRQLNRFLQGIGNEAEDIKEALQMRFRVQWDSARIEFDLFDKSGWSEKKITAMEERLKKRKTVSRKDHWAKVDLAKLVAELEIEDIPEEEVEQSATEMVQLVEEGSETYVPPMLAEAIDDINDILGSAASAEELEEKLMAAIQSLNMGNMFQLFITETSEEVEIHLDLD